MADGPRASELTASFLLEVPPDVDQVRTARLFAASLARHFGAAEDRVEDLKVAISEATTNSIKAHLDAGVPDPVRITAAREGGGLRFEVVDSGPGFQSGPAGSDGDPPTPASGLFEGSLGLTLIRSLFPDVRIGRNDDAGMTVSFVLDTSAESSGDAALD